MRLLADFRKNKYSAGLDEKFKKITRIEKYFDNEYRLIWTIEDGEIMTDNINFIKLNGIYYSAKTLEHLLQEVIFIKDAVLKLYI
ncbi:MAG: hypothetical protein MSS84_04055 [Bacteroidales bacterium]|nr:hypothetical protein [Bacteroidales bacterium]